MVVSVNGRTWEAQIHAAPGFVSDLDLGEPRTLALAGVGIACLLAVLVFMLAQSRGRARQVRLEKIRRAAIVDSSSDAIVGEGLDGRITDWNRGAEKMFGYAAAEALGKMAAALLLPPARVAEDEAIRARIARGESVFSFDTTRMRADGTLLDVSVAAAPIVGASGHLFGFCKTLRDISTSKRAEHQLKDLNATLEQQVRERTESLETAERDLRSILDAVPSVISYWDRDLRNRFANNAHQAWFGLDPTTMPGVHVRDLLGGRFAADSIPRMEAALRGEARTFELTLPPIDGREGRHMVVHYLPDRVADKVRGFYLIAYDVTQHTLDEQRLAAALRENEALLRTIHQHAIVSVTDARGRITDANQQFCRISGFSRDELLGKTHKVINSGVHDRAFWAGMWRTIASGQPWRGEICNRAKDGSLYWVDSMIAPFADADGTIEKYISIRFDITAAKIAKTELQKTAERFSLAADGEGIGVWEFDCVANTLQWDQWMYRLYGRSAKSDLEPYDLWSTSLHPDDRERCERQLGQAMEGEREFDMEFRIVWPDGQVRHLKASARVVRDAAGMAVRMTGVNLDITDRKKMELELVETSSLLQSVLGSASEVSLIATDPNLMIRVFNKGAELLLGYRSEEVVNRATPMLIHDPEEVRLRAEELTAQSGELVEGCAAFTHPLALRQPREWTYFRKDGTPVTVSLVVTAMIGDDGALFGYLGVALDVTRQKQSERSLREAILTAERANVAKSRFLANMSHEIRTPMNAVIGLSHLLAETTLDAEQAVFLSKINLASKSLLALINDILDISKIEAGELTLEREPFDPRLLLANLQDVMRVHADAKRIAFVTEIADDLPAGVVGDATRLNQVLTNLLSNAIKFTEHGRVTLRVSRQGGTPSTATLRFEVLDSGIGIPADVQKRLFVPFAQADASTTRRFGGTGLGLSIVKRLVDLMAGQLTLTSAPGTGSTFSVIVSFAVAADVRPGGAASRQPPIESGTLRGARILVVDDNELNLFVAQRLLERQGAQVSITRGGQEACQRLSADPGAIDLVLMDVQMPGLDGYETTKKIRQELGLTGLPIIALTADALVSERDKAAQAGMNDFVSKPFEPAALFAIIRRHLHGDGETSPVPPSRAALPVVDDGAGWPLMEGIDTEDARTRMSGDVALFRELLTIFLRDLGEPRSFAGDGTPADNQALTARFHKLRGAAGQIGARAIHELAGAAETALRGSDTRRATELGREMDVHLRRLGHAAAVVLAGNPPATSTPTPMA